MRRGRGLWKMDSAAITENACTEKFITLWGQLKRQKGHFPDLTKWWDRLFKKKIRQLYQREQAERRRYHCMMENHLYECMYDVLQRPGPSDQTLPALNRLKAELCDCTAEGHRNFLMTVTLLIDQMETSRRYTTSFRRNGDVQSGPYIA